MIHSYGKWRGIQQSPYGSSNSTAKKGSIGQSSNMIPSSKLKPPYLWKTDIISVYDIRKLK